MGAGRFGPNHEAAERLLDQLDHLDVPQTVALAAAGGGSFGDADQAAREELREELRAIASSAGRLDAIRKMSDEIERWATSVRHWFPAGVAGSSDARNEIPARLAAVRAVLDAAYGVILEDLLRREEADLLLRAWRDTVGDPFDREPPVDATDDRDEPPGDGGQPAG